MWNSIKEHPLVILCGTAIFAGGVGWGTCWNVWAAPRGEQRDEAMRQKEDAETRLTALRASLRDNEEGLKAIWSGLKLQERDLEDVETAIASLENRIRNAEYTDAVEFAKIIEKLKSEANVEIIGRRLVQLDETMQRVQSLENAELPTLRCTTYPGQRVDGPIEAPMDGLVLAVISNNNPPGSDCTFRGLAGPDANALEERARVEKVLSGSTAILCFSVRRSEFFGTAVNGANLTQRQLHFLSLEEPRP